MNKGLFLAAAVVTSSLFGQFFSQFGLFNNPPISSVTDPLSSYRVATGTIDVYATDKKIAALQTAIYSSINTALAARKQPQISSAESSQSFATSVLLKDISIQSGLPGVAITLSAQNLDSGAKNNVYFSSPVSSNLFVIKNLAPSANELAFTLPNFPAGRYDVAIGNSHGVSNTTFFVILAPGNPKVLITAVSPASLRWGSTLTITGSGFTPTGNEVFTTFDTISNVSSADGHTLHVLITPEQLRVEATMGTGAIVIPDTIGVVNNNGYSSTVKSFSIDI